MAHESDLAYVRTSNRMYVGDRCIHIPMFFDKQKRVQAVVHIAAVLSGCETWKQLDKIRTPDCKHYQSIRATLFGAQTYMFCYQLPKPHDLNARCGNTQYTRTTRDQQDIHKHYQVRSSNTTKRRKDSAISSHTSGAGRTPYQKISGQDRPIS